MNQLVIPLILATIMIVAIVLIVTPVQKVTTVHQSIQAFISTEHDNALTSVTATVNTSADVTLVADIPGPSFNPGLATLFVRNPPPGVSPLIVSIRTDTDDQGGPNNEIAVLSVLDNSQGSVTVAFRDGLVVQCALCSSMDTLTVVATMLVRP